MLDSIRGAGGIASLRKVDRSQIRDRSAANVGGSDTGPHGSGLPPAGIAHAGAGGGAGMADALAAALQKRKEKVSGSGKYYTLSVSYSGGVVVLIVLQMMRKRMMIGDLALLLARIVFLALRSFLACSAVKELNSQRTFLELKVGGRRGAGLGQKWAGCTKRQRMEERKVH